MESIHIIVNQLDPLHLLILVRGLCTQLDTISDTSHVYKVNFLIMHAKHSFGLFIDGVGQMIMS